MQHGIIFSFVLTVSKEDSSHNFIHIPIDDPSKETPAQPTGGEEKEFVPSSFAHHSPIRPYVVCFIFFFSCVVRSFVR